MGVRLTQSIFKKVATSERKRILREIAAERLQISVRGTNDEVFHLLAIQTEKDEVLLCHLTDDSREQSHGQKVVVNFTYKSERYFLQTDLSFKSGWAVLRTDLDMFRLQRRANARVDIPGSYEAFFTVVKHNGNISFRETLVRDMSAGGMKLMVPISEPELKSGDILQGVLRLGNRRPMEYSVEVRFVKKADFEGSQVQYAGVKFQQVDTHLENRLLSLMMDLQRELYLKFG